MKRCAKCGEEVTDDVKYCSECGGNLFRSTNDKSFIERTCPHCGETSLVPEGTEKVFCQHCGATMVLSSKPIAGICPTCKRPIMIPANSAKCVCGSCGAVVDAASAIKAFSEQRSIAQIQAAALSNAATPYATQVKNPFLVDWKTEIGSSIAGVAANGILGIVAGAMCATESTVILAFGLYLAWTILVFWYAGFYFPSLFKPESTRKPTSGWISFLNCFFGGVIFGCCWNANLTRGEKGISNVVFIVSEGIYILLLVLAVVEILLIQLS